MARIVTVVGTRPEIIKMTSVIHELRARRADYVVIHTGQHYDENLSEGFLEELDLPRPRDHGMPIQTWSFERLRDTAIREGIVEHISKERLRQILHEEAVSFQAVKTWKESHDPKFREKLRRIRELTDRKHNPPVVVALDEMGPLSLRPYRKTHRVRRGKVRQPLWKRH